MSSLTTLSGLGSSERQRQEPRPRPAGGDVSEGVELGAEQAASANAGQKERGAAA